MYNKLTVEDVDVKGKKMVVLGAGGAATALTVQCALDGAASIAIFNPNDPFRDKAKGTDEKLEREVPDCKVSVYCLDDQDKLREEIANADILANGADPATTPVETLDSGIVTVNTEIAEKVGIDYSIFKDMCSELIETVTAEEFN